MNIRLVWLFPAFLLLFTVNSASAKNDFFNCPHPANLCVSVASEGSEPITEYCKDAEGEYSLAENSSNYGKWTQLGGFIININDIDPATTKPDGKAHPDFLISRENGNFDEPYINLKKDFSIRCEDSKTTGGFTLSGISDCDGAILDTKFGKCIKCEYKKYNLGEYHLYADFQSYGQMWVDFKLSLVLDKDPEKDGKISFEGTSIKMSDVSYHVLNRINENVERDFYNQFAIKNTKGETNDLLKIVLQRLLKETGKTSGQILISSKSIDKDNQFWTADIAGKMYQSRYTSSNSEHNYNELIGPFGASQIKEVHAMFLRKITQLMTEDFKPGKWIYENKGDGISVNWTKGKKTTRKSDGGVDEIHDADVAVYYKNGKLLRIDYYEYLGSDRTKKISYVPPEEDIDNLVGCIHKPSSKSKASSQSVWMMRQPADYPGIAYKFSPSYSFPVPVEIYFNEGSPVHYEDIMISGCNYSVLSNSSETIDVSGGMIRADGVSQKFFPGSVLNKTNFKIEVLNISSCNLCNDFIKDGNEKGTDCGGECAPCGENCFDGIKNQDETGVDCGGICRTNAPEGCGFDFNRDCKIKKCANECISDRQCIFSPAEKGRCFFGKCIFETTKKDAVYFSNQWKNGGVSFVNLMKYLSYYTG
jgi:hypothetical protein